MLSPIVGTLYGMNEFSFNCSKIDVLPALSSPSISIRFSIRPDVDWPFRIFIRSQPMLPMLAVLLGYGRFGISLFFLDLSDVIV